MIYNKVTNKKQKIMKQVFLTLALVVIISLVSCKKTEVVVEPTTTDSTAVAVDSTVVDTVAIEVK